MGKSPFSHVKDPVSGVKLPVLLQTLWQKKSHIGAVVTANCHGRILENIIGKENLIQFDALSFYKKYTDRFDIDSVPEAERNEVARYVANTVLAKLRKREANEVEKTENIASCN
jgi:hypothetical protein